MTDTDRIKQRFLDFRRRLYGEHDLDAVDEHLHPDFWSHGDNLRPRFEAYRQAALDRGATQVDMRPAYKDFARIFHLGVPDLRPVSQALVVEGTSLMAMTSWVATHTGPLFAVPATGKTLHFATADRYRLQDGLLIEHWDVVDLVDAWSAIGLIVRHSASAPPVD